MLRAQDHSHQRERVATVPTRCPARSTRSNKATERAIVSVRLWGAPAQDGVALGGLPSQFPPLLMLSKCRSPPDAHLCRRCHFARACTQSLHRMALTCTQFHVGQHVITCGSDVIQLQHEFIGFDAITQLLQMCDLRRRIRGEQPYRIHEHKPSRCHAGAPFGSMVSDLLQPAAGCTRRRASPIDCHHLNPPWPSHGHHRDDPSAAGVPAGNFPTLPPSPHPSADQSLRERRRAPDTGA